MRLEAHFLDHTGLTAALTVVFHMMDRLKIESKRIGLRQGHVWLEG